MAHRDPISISQEPVDLAAGETTGSVLVGQVTGPEAVLIRDAPATGRGSGFRYKPGEFFQITVEAGQGNWAWCNYNESSVSLADG